MYALDEWILQNNGRDSLLKHFGTLNLKGFGIEEIRSGIIAAGAVLHYLRETAHLILRISPPFSGLFAEAWMTGLLSAIWNYKREAGIAAESTRQHCLLWAR